MADPVHGKNVTLSVDVGNGFFPALCATDVSYLRSVEFVERTGPASGRSREIMPRIQEWNGSVSGLTKIQNTAEALSFFYLLQDSERWEGCDVRITFEDETGDFVNIEGAAFLGTMGIVSNIRDFSNCSIEIKGTGDFEMTTTPPDPVGTVEPFSDWWPTVNGLSYVAVGAVASSIYGYTLTATDEILEVDMEGIEHERVGTPVNRDYKFNTSTLRVEFPSDIIFDGTQRVFIEFKR